MRVSRPVAEATVRPMRRLRRGMTLLELIVVMAITTTLGAIFWKPMSETFDESSRRAASREVASYLIRARAAAVQRSRQTWFVRTGNTIKVVTDSAGVKVAYGKPLNMMERHGVTLLPSKDSISFDPRGFTTLVTPAPRIIVSAGAGADTICVTGLGTISTRKCS
jgi:prepilin-type N-terminal cleavage/methylation domain-containing protein